MHASAFAFCYALDKRLFLFIVSFYSVVAVCLLKSHGNLLEEEEEQPFVWADGELVQLTLSVRREEKAIISEGPLCRPF
jgi:hypothetical protein